MSPPARPTLLTPVSFVCTLFKQTNANTRRPAERGSCLSGPRVWKRPLRVAAGAGVRAAVRTSERRKQCHAASRSWAGRWGCHACQTGLAIASGPQIPVPLVAGSQVQRLCRKSKQHIETPVTSDGFHLIRQRASVNTIQPHGPTPTQYCHAPITTHGIPPHLPPVGTGSPVSPPPCILGIWGSRAPTRSCK